MFLEAIRLCCTVFVAPNEQEDLVDPDTGASTWITGLKTHSGVESVLRPLITQAQHVGMGPPQVLVQAGAIG